MPIRSGQKNRHIGNWTEAVRFGGALSDNPTVLPEVEATGHRWTSRDHGWRDSVCGRIGMVVRTACSEQQFGLDFLDNSTVSISIRDEDYMGPEAFMRSVGNHPIIVG